MGRRDLISNVQKIFFLRVGGDADKLRDLEKEIGDEGKGLEEKIITLNIKSIAALKVKMVIKGRGLFTYKDLDFLNERMRSKGEEIEVMNEIDSINEKVDEMIRVFGEALERGVAFEDDVLVIKHVKSFYDRYKLVMELGEVTRLVGELKEKRGMNDHVERILKKTGLRERIEKIKRLARSNLRVVSDNSSGRKYGAA